MTKKILVAGDTLVDIYVEGSVTRVSAEAPIPILDVVSEKRALGGAANVAANIRTLYGDDLLIYYFGFYSTEVMELLRQYHIQPLGEYIYDGEILKKHRYHAGTHQILRVDNRKKYDDFLAKRMQQEWIIDYKQYDLVVVADYNKGTIGDVFYSGLSYQKPMTILENKTPCARGFHKNLIFKCNDKEYFKSDLCLQSWSDVSKEVVVTQGKEGYMLVKENRRFPAIQKQGDVVDVCGAGDCFTAGMAVNYLETGEFNPGSMAAFGNIVSGEKVKHFGTIAVKREWIK